MGRLLGIPYIKFDVICSCKGRKSIPAALTGSAEVANIDITGYLKKMNNRDNGMDCFQRILDRTQSAGMIHGQCDHQQGSS